MALIRTTFSSRLQSLARQNTTTASKMAKANLRAASGLELTRPSDKPGSINRLHAVRGHMADQDMWMENADWATSVQYTADDALDGLGGLLADARELAVQLASEVYSDADRQQAETEAQALLESAVALGNTKLGDHYIFAGFAYDSPAFDASGVYLGDTGSPEVPVGDGVSTASGFDGSSLLQGAGGDMLAAFDALATALNGGLADDVAASLDDIDAGLAQLSLARTTLGSEMILTEDASELAENLKVELVRQESSLVDADQVESYTDLFKLQTAYEASIQVTASARTTLLFSRL